MSRTFDKKIYTAWLFLTDIAFLLWRIPRLFAASRNPDINRAFVERIMTVTTAVNGCVYCTWFHAKQAVAAGIAADEVRDLFNLQFQADAPERELMGLLYAQHYAETNRQPDPEMSARLLDRYGERTARHVLLFIRMITFGNLLGNTWDAALSRFKGRPAPRSNPVFEAVFLLLTWWIMVPLMWAMRRDRTREAAA
ncbi:MAG: carboxymuconolactone decarboxylase family protein [Deltaproteobacteria bacterium]|nr:MAG: carboxymuconolactone decarboxylase family protein [Deltaproteobacteria bacterium]